MSEDQGFSVNDLNALDEAQRGVVWGIYDTLDNCWIGDDTGPKLLTYELLRETNGAVPLQTLARIAAMMAEVQVGYTPGRLQAREFNGENLQLKDHVDAKMTSLEALIKLETGT